MIHDGFKSCRQIYWRTNGSPHGRYLDFLSEVVANRLQKYTTQSTGIWEKIRNALSVVPNRSNGIPLNSQYRNPPPGANDPLAFDDPVTVPAGDIADNPYYKRDVRRNYPRASIVSQGDLVGLLTVGTKALPKDEKLPVGEAGIKALTLVKEEGEKGLSAYFQKDSSSLKSFLGPDGLPPNPVAMHLPNQTQSKRYSLEPEQTYGEK